MRRVPDGSAAACTAAVLASVRDDPAARLALLRRLYAGDAGRRHLPYRRAAVAFMAWQLRRNLLNPTDAAPPGSPWWRAVNERLLHDGCEARALAAGHRGVPSSPGVVATEEFVRRPSAATWYRAHNISIVSAYLANEHLAGQESRGERFFMNLVLVRVLYAHAMVAAPALALGRFGRIAPPLGDPRGAMTGMFLSLARVLPDRYPIGDDVEPYVTGEHGLGHLLDLGVIQPRLERLYGWSATELGLPGLLRLVRDGAPAYAWPSADAAAWQIRAVSLPARIARRVVR